MIRVLPKRAKTSEEIAEKSDGMGELGAPQLSHAGARWELQRMP